MLGFLKQGPNPFFSWTTMNIRLWQLSCSLYMKIPKENNNRAKTLVIETINDNVKLFKEILEGRSYNTVSEIYPIIQKTPYNPLLLFPMKGCDISIHNSVIFKNCLWKNYSKKVKRRDMPFNMIWYLKYCTSMHLLTGYMVMILVSLNNRCWNLQDKLK